MKLKWKKPKGAHGNPHTYNDIVAIILYNKRHET